MSHWNEASESKDPETRKHENAIKAKLRRLCDVKKSGKLQVPEWLHTAWKNGNHLSPAS